MLLKNSIFLYLLIEFLKIQLINIKKYCFLKAIILTYLFLVVYYINLDRIIIESQRFTYNVRNFYLFPASYEKFPIKKVKLNNFYVYAPELEDRQTTGYSPLPSINYLPGKEKLKLRGNGIKDGFKIDNFGND